MDALLTTAKWEILRILSHRPSSPLEIAKTLQTTIANVSQQLRLLEAAGLVTRNRVPNSQAGKPRALYSITENICSLAIITDGFAERTQISLSPTQAFLARALLYESAGIALTKWFFALEKLPKALYLKSIADTIITVEAVPGPGESQETTITVDSKSYTITMEVVQQASPESTVLYS